MSDIVVITGATRGIGLALATAFAERGLRVALFGREITLLRKAAKAVERVGGEPMTVVADVTNEDEMQRGSLRVLREWGTPRVVIANAGIIKRAPVHELAIADFDDQIAVNLRGAFLLAHHFVGPMRAAKKGRFIAIASISATLGTANASAYNASKWGLVGFVKSLAEELVGTGVQALAVNPGAVSTDMLVGSPYAARMSPEDVARLVRYAALEAPDALNGSALDMFGA